MRREAISIIGTRTGDDFPSKTETCIRRGTLSKAKAEEHRYVRRAVRGSIRNGNYEVSVR